MVELAIPGVKLMDASQAEGTPQVYGLYGHLTSGKTHLAATAAKYYQEQGKKVLYLVTPNEDPYMTLAGHGLGGIIFPLTSMGDFDKIAQQAKNKVDVVILDSIKGLNRMTMDKAIGKDRYPADSKEWAPVHDAFTSAVNKFKEIALISIFLCPADRSADSFVTPDAKKPNLITADLPGKMAAGIAGSVSAMGYVESELDEDTKTFKRTVSFVPSRKTISFARGLRRPMVEPIVLDTFEGGWAAVQSAFEVHRQEVVVE